MKRNHKTRRLAAERLETRDLCASDWQNIVNRYDVNGSGNVEAIDALVIINELARGGSGALPTKNADYTGPLRDVNGDSRLSAVDALMVINFLQIADVGDLAPEVRLPNQDNEQIDLSSYIGQGPVVLYFYPKDNTPGCTIEALDFSNRKAEIESLGAKIFGVSLDSVDSHTEFATDHKLNFDILADEQRTATNAYGVLTTTSNGLPIARRTTFIIGTDGTIAKVFTDVQVASHGSEVVEALRAGVGSVR
jgi:thioredoxin-dependent peroxiredoxin